MYIKHSRGNSTALENARSISNTQRCKILTRRNESLLSQTNTDIITKTYTESECGDQFGQLFTWAEHENDSGGQFGHIFDSVYFYKMIIIIKF